jgi:hypothetical protein
MTPDQIISLLQFIIPIIGGVIYHFAVVGTKLGRLETEIEELKTRSNTDRESIVEIRTTLRFISETLARIADKLDHRA